MMLNLEVKKGYNWFCFVFLKAEYHTKKYIKTKQTEENTYSQY